MTDAPPSHEGAIEDAEDAEDALLEGDRTFTPGTARAALSHRTFRTVYLGAFASNIGTWMQNVVLGALAYDLTGSGVFVGLIIFAQLGPLLLLSIVGGMLADTSTARSCSSSSPLEQALCSVVLALVACSAPTRRRCCSSASTSVDRHRQRPLRADVQRRAARPRAAEDMPGAISLNSVQMNASRVVGPVIGSFLFAAVRPVAGCSLSTPSATRPSSSPLSRVTLAAAAPPTGTQGLHRLLEGVRYARDRPGGRPVPGHDLRVLAVLPAVHHPDAEDRRRQPRHRTEEHRPTASSTRAFGLGAVIGALSIGTVFASGVEAPPHPARAAGLRRVPDRVRARCASPCPPIRSSSASAPSTSP